MNRKLFFAAMAATALASCTNDDLVEVNHGEGIAFRASLDKALTRGTTTNLQNLNAFKVTAFGQDEANNYFTDMPVTSDDQGKNWKTGATYYWPGFDLKFFAYAPQDLENVSISKNAQTITDFAPVQTVKSQKDLLVSYNTGNKNNNEANGVAMNFKHALSQIEVKAKCSNEKIKIEVIGLKMVNAAAKANFAFPNAETNTVYKLEQGQWHDWTDKDNHDKAYMIKDKGNKVTLTKNAQSLMFGEGGMMLIPQQLTAWNGTASKTGAYLSVLCRIYSLDNGNETLLYPRPAAGDNKDNKYAFSAVAISTNWEPGKKYIYTLNFCGENGGAGEIDPNPTNPVDPTDPDVEEKPGTGGEEILGKPISFTVTVDEWADKTEDVEMK